MYTWLRHHGGRLFQYYYLLKDRDLLLLLTAGPYRGSSRKWRRIPFRGLPPCPQFCYCQFGQGKRKWIPREGLLGHAQARSTTAGTRVQTIRRPKSGTVRDCLTRYLRSDVSSNISHGPLICNLKYFFERWQTH